MSAIPPAITLHALGPSHPCRTVEAALQLKGLPYERIDFALGEHVERMTEIYGPARTTVPGLLVGEERVHGSVAILERLEQLHPEPSLYPPSIAEAVHEAERWGDAVLQDLGRRLPWGALHYRPDALGTFVGGGPLDEAGTEFARKVVRATWRYHGITEERLQDDLHAFPAMLDRIDALAADGTIGADHVNAADLQIGATLATLLTVEDLRPLMADRPGEALARRLFPDVPGQVPAGAFPAGWVPAR
ncbi:glutathione S-transferase [Patulibacter sp. SYSU D01012]|uniref:glutathione S-transferase family protein n=1 Tax=Patulibacter sp. SYSU D01012 TaxID=2817381 RepID=UPI001B3090E4|nr:glutathione S-transferase [Patulibacter sp. SYSU D01012]